MDTPDPDLMRRWRLRRDASAFAEIVARYSGMVYATCRRILVQAPDAEEVAQDCFLAMAEADVKVGGYLGPWLHRVAVRRALNRLKAKKRRHERERRFAEEASMDTVEPTWDDLSPHIDEAVSALPEKLRRPVVMHFLEGRTQAATAEALGLPRRTVTARIAKGVEEIRGELRRRGIPVTQALLVALLGEDLSQAAPPALVARLGRLALAGGRPASAILGISRPVLAKIAVGGVALASLAGLGYLLAPNRPDDEPESGESLVAVQDADTCLIGPVLNIP
jgi:RNA polymerase sigma factor (sigma-70 family)